MLKLIVAAAIALAIGVTAKDLSTTSDAAPQDAWEARAAEVDTYVAENIATGDAHDKLTETGEQIKDWLLDRVSRNNP